MFCRLRGFSVTATEIKGKCCKQKEATADLVILGKISIMLYGKRRLLCQDKMDLRN